MTPTQTAAFRSGCHVHSVSEQTVAGQGDSHDASQHGICKEENGRAQPICVSQGLDRTVHVKSVKAVQQISKCPLQAECGSRSSGLQRGDLQSPWTSGGKQRPQFRTS